METTSFENAFKLPFPEAERFEETLVAVTAKLLALRESDESSMVYEADDAHPYVSVDAGDDDPRVFNVVVDDSPYSVTRTWAAYMGLDGKKKSDLLTVRKGKLEENNIIDPSESEYQQVIKAIARALESVETLDAVADSEHNVRLGRVQSLLRRGARRLFS